MEDKAAQSEIDQELVSVIQNVALPDTERAAQVAQLLERGAGVDAVDPSTSLTPLHVAAQFYSPGVTQLLLEAGADVDAVNSSGNTALITAVGEARGRGEVLMLLLQAGADPDRTNNFGMSARRLASLTAKYDNVGFFEGF